MIIEPASIFGDRARPASLPNLQVKEGLVECVGWLHEARSPDLILSAVRPLVGPETRLHVNFPNLAWFHRVFGSGNGLDSAYEGDERAQTYPPT